MAFYQRWVSLQKKEKTYTLKNNILLAINVFIEKRKNIHQETIFYQQSVSLQNKRSSLKFSKHATHDNSNWTYVHTLSVRVGASIPIFKSKI